MARDMVINGNKKNIDKLATMMQCHESQQSASIIATIAIIIGNKMNSKEMNVDEKYRRAIGDIILWNTPVIKDKNGWPKRKKYSFMQLFSDPEHRIETKMIVHGYLGYKDSKEMEQFFTTGELKRIAHYEEGIWIAPTRSTFKSYLPDMFPERPYIIHQNSPLAWSIPAYIH